MSARPCSSNKAIAQSAALLSGPQRAVQAASAFSDWKTGPLAAAGLFDWLLPPDASAGWRDASFNASWSSPTAGGWTCIKTDVAKATRPWNVGGGYGS